MIVHTASYLPKQSAKSFVSMVSDEHISEKTPASTSPSSLAPAQPAKAANKDDLLLAELGYKQEFKREFSVFSCICFAFSIMGVIASVSSTVEFGLYGGGHVGFVWGWFIPGFFVIPIALCLAELCSAMPTSGGLYYWSSNLAPEEWSAFWSWMTGYCNVFGQIALVCSITYTTAQMICVAVTVGSDFETVYSLGIQYAIFIALLASMFFLCSAATKVLAKLTYVYAFINIATTIATIICFAVVPAEHVSAKTAFADFENLSTWNAGTSFLLAFTAPMWTLTGWDSASHIAEEVSNASTAGPLAMVVGVTSTWLLGFFVLISASFAILDINALAETTLSLPMGQVFYDVLGKHGMLTIWGFIIVVQYTTAAAQLVDASRVVFAVSRDGLLPMSAWLRKLNPTTVTPVFGTLFVTVCSAVLGLLALNSQAGLALFGVAVIGLYSSYALPIFLRLLPSGRARFRPGPFTLGRAGVPLGLVSVCWVSFIVVMLLFPADQAPDAASMNYSVVIFGALIVGALLAWVVSARKWFKGPIRQVYSTGTAAVEFRNEDDKDEGKEGGGAKTEVRAASEEVE